MNKPFRFLAAAALSLAALSGAIAAEAGEKGAAATSALTAGEVRKVDAARGKVTLRHEAIANLDMPAMTMVFRVSKPEQLKDLKAGDKVRFHAESDKGNLVVTQIEAAQ